MTRRLTLTLLWTVALGVTLLVTWALIPGWVAPR